MFSTISFSQHLVCNFVKAQRGFILRCNSCIKNEKLLKILILKRKIPTQHIIHIVTENLVFFLVVPILRPLSVEPIAVRISEFSINDYVITCLSFCHQLYFVVNVFLCNAPDTARSGGKGFLPIKH